MPGNTPGRPPPRPGDPAYPAYARDSFIYVLGVPVEAAAIIVVTLSAVHHLWIALAGGVLLAAAYGVVAWRALMRLPKRHG